MSDRKKANTGEIRARLEAIRAEKRNRVRWQVSPHTAEQALAAISARPDEPRRPGSKSRRRKRHKRLL